jgi:WD40 repeat protein
VGKDDDEDEALLRTNNGGEEIGDEVGYGISGVVWNPNPSYQVLLVTIRHVVMMVEVNLFQTPFGREEEEEERRMGRRVRDDPTTEMTRSLFKGYGKLFPKGGGRDEYEEEEEEDDDDEDEEEEEQQQQQQQQQQGPKNFRWSDCQVFNDSLLSYSPHPYPLSSLSMHHNGDYFVVTSASSPAPSLSLIIHQVTKRRCKRPLRKLKQANRVFSASFHPTLPLLFTLSSSVVRVYNLLDQQFTVTIPAPSTTTVLTALALHPNGDHVVLGTSKGKVLWYEMDSPNTPAYKLRPHTSSVRDIIFHAKYPLFATCSADGKTNIFHNTIYDDLLRPPMIVPVKSLSTRGTRPTALEFHKKEAWIYIGSSDGRIRLFQNL